MGVLTVHSVQKFIVQQNGRRVLFVGTEDKVTPAALDWLRAEGVEIRPKPSEKPEQMTHLRGGELVPKTHPVIAFRGMLDQLQAEILWVGSKLQGQLRTDLAEILMVTRQIMRCQVLEEPWTERQICGLTEAELRQRSHEPEKYYGQGHFMPDFSDKQEILELNRLRTMVRKTELAGCRAMPEREDLLRVLNRLSSLLWILMIREKKGMSGGTEH